MKSRFLGKKIPVISCGKQLRDVQEACAPFQVIAVDEGQFVSGDSCLFSQVQFSSSSTTSSSSAKIWLTAGRLC